MNKILIIGHASSDYETLEKILQQTGMAKPLPSYTHKMSPNEITKKLLKAATSNNTLPTNAITYNQSKNQVATIDNRISNQVAYSQKKPKKIWDNLAFDLILANLDQDFWGWSDSEAISLLEYWAEFDNEMAFILTYDKPANLLEKLLQNKKLADIDETLIFEALQEWQDYNQTLLNFYEKYPNRCILVNGEQVIKSIDDYLKSVAKKIDWISSTILEQSDFEIVKENDTLNNQNILDFFIEQLLNSHQESLSLFANMQKKADIALIEKPIKNNVSHALNMLKEVIQQQNKLSNTQKENDDIKKQLTESQHQSKQLQQKIQSNQDENTLLINQLHSVQEELETYYLKNQKYQTENKQVKNELEEHKKKIDITNQEIQKKQSEIEKLLKEKQAIAKNIAEQQEKNQSSESENQLLISQLHSVQEQLEKLYIENQQYKTQVSKQKEQVVSFEKKTSTKQKELEESKKTIETLLKDKQNLDKELSEQKNHCKTTEFKLTQLQSDIKDYQETANLAAALKQENELLVSQLHHVQEELESYYLQVQKLKQDEEKIDNKQSDKDSKVTTAVYYGAAERVKNDLPYRLGYTMVKRGKTPKDLVGLPLALVKEYRDFQKNQSEQPLPPLEDYQDVEEAEKVKKHLSYKLGKAMVDGIKSPRSLLKVPNYLIKK